MVTYCQCAKCFFSFSSKTFLELQNYRVKILGLPSGLHREDLAKKLGHRQENQIFIYDRTVFIIQLKSLKYAKQLVERCHGKTYMTDFLMKCQLELNLKKFPQHRQSQSEQQQHMENGIEDLSPSKPYHSVRLGANSLSKSSNNISTHVDQSPTTELVDGTAAKDEPDFPDTASPRTVSDMDLIDPSRSFGIAIDGIKKQTQNILKKTTGK